MNCHGLAGRMSIVSAVLWTRNRVKTRQRLSGKSGRGLLVCLSYPVFGGGEGLQDLIRFVLCELLTTIHLHNTNLTLTHTDFLSMILLSLPTRNRTWVIAGWLVYSVEVNHGGICNISPMYEGKKECHLTWSYFMSRHLLCFSFGRPALSMTWFQPLCCYLSLQLATMWIKITRMSAERRAIPY